MKNKGFTLMEVIIACAVLSLFFIGLLSLYSSGSKMGNATMWLQSTTSQLKNAARQINTSIRKSSYPTKIEFPQNIIEAKKDCFYLQYYKGILKSPSTETTFLVSVESSPAKTGFSENTSAFLTYHIFTLDNNENLTYYKDKVEVTADDINENFERKIKLPPDKGIKTILVRNVESVECLKKRDDDKAQPIEIKITCFMPKSNGTRRSETAVGTPNVDLKCL